MLLVPDAVRNIHGIDLAYLMTFLNQVGLRIHAKFIGRLGKLQKLFQQVGRVNLKLSNGYGMPFGSFWKSFWYIER